jgi:prepilin-type N-terminal cleavage/methylation domain-containing protein
MTRKPGFTFLELLIATSLFVIGMVSVLQIFPINRRFLTQSSQTSQASFIAQEQMEKVRGTDYDSLTVGNFEARDAVSDDSSDPMSLYERQTVVTLIDGNRNATATDVGLKKVDITVYWTERSVDRTYSLTTYVYEK